MELPATAKPRKLILGLGLAVAAAACLDADTVFHRPSVLESAPDAARGFLGYAASTDPQRPICGNCHVGTFGGWRNTRHAHAWTTLQESGQAAKECEGCHTVGARGNWVTDTLVAWTGTRDPRYHDVQCESCHGPGVDHVANPDAFQPLAQISVGLDLESGCGECHSGAHQPFVEEWSQSRHGQLDPVPQSQAACVSCHEARGVLAAWGISTDYLEKSGGPAIPIVCAVCHDPHNATNTKQLRFRIDVPDESANLCMRCHNQGGVPGVTVARRPHSPQGPLLLGTAGWRPPGFVFGNDSIVGSHGTTANPELCATCHVARLEVTDRETGAFVFQATGHLFQATPCLDANGIPTTERNCAVTERSFAACARSGCHGSPDAARGALTVARARVDGLLAQLNGQLAQLPAAQFDSTDGRLTTAEGARFNAELSALRGSPVHNPFLVEELLRASIQRVQADYGVAPAPPRGAGRRP